MMLQDLSGLARWWQRQYEDTRREMLAKTRRLLEGEGLTEAQIEEILAETQTFIEGVYAGSFEKAAEIERTGGRMDETLN